VTRIGELGTTQAATSNRRMLRRNTISSQRSSETSVLTRATRRNIPKDTILHSHRREVVWCTEEKGNCKTAVIVFKAMFDCGGNTSQRSVSEVSEKYSMDPRKDDFLKIIMKSSHFFKRDTRLE
jgi:hypothetical protein